MVIIKKTISPLGYISFLSFFGFILGVLYVFLKKENILISDGILNEEILFKIQNTQLDRRVFLFLCLGSRFRYFLLFLFLAYSSINIIFNSLFFLTQGFFVGSVMEILSLRFGVHGLIVYLGLVLPQGIFYLLGYLSLACWCLKLEDKQEKGFKRKVTKLEKKPGYKKIFIALVLLCVGILLETYVNPIFIQFIWQLLNIS